MQTTYLVVGLGNPEEKYERTFHNVGFMAVDSLAKLYDQKWKERACQSIVSQFFVGGNKIILAKPQTYMNLSGLAVKELVARYKVELENVVVLYDDYDIEKGKFKIRQKGSAGSHNGMKSIVYELGSNVFNRMRIGIFDREIEIPIINYVLSNISNENMPIYQEVCCQVAEACKLFIEGKPMQQVMNLYNR